MCEVILVDKNNVLVYIAKPTIIGCPEDHKLLIPRVPGNVTYSPVTLLKVLGRLHKLWEKSAIQ